MTGDVKVARPGRFTATVPRVDVWTIAFVALASAAVIFLLWLGRGLTFFWDEWAWIYERQSWSFDSLMSPVNEHWSTVPIVIYKILLDTVGMTSYLPYLLVMLVLHVAVVAAIFRFARQTVGPAVAVSLAAILLLFGAGYENLVWAAGIFFLSAVASGVWALVLVLEPGHTHDRLVAVLLVLTTASSGIGLFFLVAVGVAILIGRDPLRRFWMVIPAGVVYLAWYVTIGSPALRTPITPQSFVNVPEFMGGALSSTAASLVGGSSDIVPFVLLPVAVAAVVALRSPRARVAIAAATGGLLAQSILTGLVRAPFEAGLSRYQYVTLVFLIIIATAALGTFAWRDRRPIVALGAALAIASVAAGLPVLLNMRDWYAFRADTTRALVEIQLAYGGSPALPDDSISVPIPKKRAHLVVGAPRDLKAALVRYGSPLDDSIYGKTPVSRMAFDGVLFQLISANLAFARVALPPEVANVELVEQQGVTVKRTGVAGGCVEAIPTAPEPWIVVSAAPSQRLFIGGDGGTARVFYSRYGNFVSDFPMNYDLVEGYVSTELQPDVYSAIVAPDLGDDVPWQMRIDLPSAVPTTVCASPDTASPSLT